MPNDSTKKLKPPTGALMVFALDEWPEAPFALEQGAYQIPRQTDVVIDTPPQENATGETKLKQGKNNAHLQNTIIYYEQ